MGLAQFGVSGMLRLAPVTLPREDAIALDGTVLVVVLGVSLLTGVLFGLAPIGRLLRFDVDTPIRDGRRSTVGAGGHGVQNAFVVAQLAMALMLVVGAGLLLKIFANLHSVEMGFRSSGVLSWTCRPQWPKAVCLLHESTDVWRERPGELRRRLPPRLRQLRPRAPQDTDQLGVLVLPGEVDEVHLEEHHADGVLEELDLGVSVQPDLAEKVAHACDRFVVVPDLLQDSARFSGVEPR